MRIKVGITATQNGITDIQSKIVYLILALIAAELNHGDCIGGDTQVHYIAKTLGLYIVIRPSDIDNKRSFLEGNEVLPPKAPLERNRDTVNAVDLMLACPKETAEVIRSGTWATVRYARKVYKPIIIIWPDGTVKLDNCDKLRVGVL